MVGYATADVPKIELMLALKGADQALGVRFAPGVERAFLVGAAENADYRISGSDSNVIEFSVERQGDYLVVLPGYRGRDVRLNGAPVLGATPLPEYATLEFGQRRILCRLYARVIDPTNEPPISGLRLLSDRELPQDCFHGAPALGPIGPEPPSALPVQKSGSDALTTLHVPALSLGDREPTSIVPNMTVAISPAEMMGVFGTASYPAAAVSPPAAVVAPEPKPIAQGPAGTAVVSTLTAEQAQALLPARLPDKQELEKRRVVVRAPLPVREDAPDPVQSAPPSMPKPKPNAVPWQAATREYSGVAHPIAGIAPMQKLAEANVPKAGAQLSLLAKLGCWARQRPVGATALAVTSGLVVALVFAQVVKPSSKSSGQPVVLSHVAPAPSAPAIVTVKVAETTPAVVAAATGPVRLELEGDAKLLETKAIEHLAAGRHGDALRSYEALLAQSPDNVVLQAAVRLLRARGSKDCEPVAGQAAKPTACPEFLP